MGQPLGPVRALSLAVRPGPGPGQALPPCLWDWSLGSSPGVSPTCWLCDFRRGQPGDRASTSQNRCDALCTV